MLSEANRERANKMSDKVIELRKQIDNTLWYKFRALSKLRKERRKAVLKMTKALLS